MTTKGRNSWGSIRKRGKSSWELRYTVAGRQKTATVRGTKRDASRALAELRIKYEDVSEEMTLSKFWDAVYLPEVEGSLSASTVAGYKRVFKNHVAPAFGEMELREIRPRDIQSWLDGMTKGQARHCRAVLSTVLSRAYALEYIDDNPAQRRFRMPQEANKERQRMRDVYSLDELDAIFQDCRGELWEAAFILAAFGGAQRGEAMGVKTSEVDFTTEKIGGEDSLFATVPIKRSAQRLNHEVQVLNKPKNEYRKRSLVIPPPYSERLREIVEANLDNGFEWLTDSRMDDELPMDPEVMAKTYSRWFKSVPHRYIPFSNLRNSYSTVMHYTLHLEDSAVSKLMGHANLTTDYNHYNRPDAADKINMLREAYENLRQSQGEVAL